MSSMSNGETYWFFKQAAREDHIFRKIMTMKRLFCNLKESYWYVLKLSSSVDGVSQQKVSICCRVATTSVLHFNKHIMKLMYSLCLVSYIIHQSVQCFFNPKHHEQLLSSIQEPQGCDYMLETVTSLWT